MQNILLPSRFRTGDLVSLNTKFVKSRLHKISFCLSYFLTAWICATEISVADPSRPIVGAAVLSRVSGKVSACLRLVQQQHKLKLDTMEPCQPVSSSAS